MYTPSNMLFQTQDSKVYMLGVANVPRLVCEVTQSILGHTIDLWSQVYTVIPQSCCTIVLLLSDQVRDQWFVKCL